jgi:Flp pilus assembly protein TadG
MIKQLTPKRRLRTDEEGAAVVEIAFALPVVIMFIWGIAQFGMVMAADAGIQNALGEGARMAPLFPTPTNTAVRQRMENSLFGNFLGSYTISPPVLTTSSTGRQMDLSITYTVTPNFIFFNGPQITMPRSKRVYLTT